MADNARLSGNALGTAAQHASSRVPIARPGDQVADVLGTLPGRSFDCADVIAVCDGPRLTGLVTLERLLAAHPQAEISSVMDPDPPTISPGADQEHAAWTAVQHGEPGLAVVSEAGNFVGLIPPQRLIGVLLEEHDEDVARLAGYLASTRSARHALSEPVMRRLWHRVPWLIVGLAGAMVSALIVGQFEQQLERQVLIALFVPGVVYIADAVGTQTEALMIRGLSVGVSIARVAGREAVTGIALGLLLAALALPLIWWGWGHADLALAVGVAILAASSIATLVAMILPVVFSKFGADPAYGSGPLSTVVQDVLSVLIYFLTAAALIT
ncbi:magnesium transporter [Hoyosella sp. YIM 151337]|uniref:magnesium transporter n=1 Tax=Hoyosella sp. YIM 151337 TaxID=2992742 RepID=UPI002236591A|nr:magnesium transporter [Hoyosella sp. YIM 151337]MCW4354378.1 magnesium transporter [Hoyosella sp. YIM 151337]